MSPGTRKLYGADDYDEAAFDNACYDFDHDDECCYDEYDEYVHLSVHLHNTNRTFLPPSSLLSLSKSPTLGSCPDGDQRRRERSRQMMGGKADRPAVCILHCFLPPFYYCVFA